MQYVGKTVGRGLNNKHITTSQVTSHNSLVDFQEFSPPTSPLWTDCSPSPVLFPLTVYCLPRLTWHKWSDTKSSEPPDFLQQTEWGKLHSTALVINMNIRPSVHIYYILCTLTGDCCYQAPLPLCKLSTIKRMKQMEGNHWTILFKLSCWNLAVKMTA